MAKSREYPCSFPAEEFAGTWVSLLTCGPQGALLLCSHLTRLGNHTDWTSDHLGSVSPARTWLGADVRMRE